MSVWIRKRWPLGLLLLHFVFILAALGPISHAQAHAHAPPLTIATASDREPRGVLHSATLEFEQDRTGIAWVLVRLKEVDHTRRLTEVSLQLRLANRGDEPLTLRQQDVELVAPGLEVFHLSQFPSNDPVRLDPDESRIIDLRFRLSDADYIEVLRATLAITLRHDGRPMTRTTVLPLGDAIYERL